MANQQSEQRAEQAPGPGANSAAAGGAGRSLSVPLVAALDEVWQAIRVRHPQVPAVVIALGSGTYGERAGVTRLGHFAPVRWRQTGAAGAIGASGGELAEMFVGGEGLERGPVDVLGTLLHEAVHGYAHAQDIQDTSRQGRWHNERFRALAAEFGLVVEKTAGIGWSTTTVPDTTAAAYAAQVDRLAAAITAHRRGEQPARSGAGGEGTASSTNYAAALCGCMPPRRIRVAASVLALGAITCALCGAEFTLPESD